MLSVSLFLLVVLILYETTVALQSADCDRCNTEGRWWPLFKPSLILSSEFPEHSKYKRSHDPPLTYSSYEHVTDNRGSGVSRLVSIGKFGGKISGGLNTPLRKYKINGRHGLEWDHYGQQGHVSTGNVNRLERVGTDQESAEEGEVPKRIEQWESVIPQSIGSVGGSGEIVRNSEDDLMESRGNTQFSGDLVNSGQVIRFGKEDIMSSGDVERIIKEGSTVSSEGNESEERENPKLEQKLDDISKQDENTSGQDGSFFNEGSFFDENISSSIDRLPGDFEISKEFTLSHEAHDTTSSNSIELPSTNWYSDSSFKSHRPVATSYSAMTSTFGGIRPVRPRMKNLLHPDIAFNDASMYVNSPASRSKFFDGKNNTSLFISHNEDPGATRINNIPKSPNFAPWVLSKSSEGTYHQHPFSRNALKWQEARPRGNPVNRIVHHESKIQHIVPTRDPFSEFNWAETRRIEQRKPSSFSKTLYFFKKKPIEYKKPISRRQAHNYVYYVKSNNRIS